MCVCVGGGSVYVQFGMRVCLCECVKVHMHVMSCVCMCMFLCVYDSISVCMRAYTDRLQCCVCMFCLRVTTEES